MHALSVRAKLMLLYFLVTLAGLLIFGLMSFGALQYALLQGKKTHLKGREDRLVSLLTENRAKGITQPLSEQLRNYALVTHEGNLFHIHNLDGSLFFPSEGIGREWALPATDDCTQPMFSSVAVDKSSVLVMCHTISLDGRMVRLHTGGSLEEETYILRTYRNALSSYACPVDSFLRERLLSEPACIKTGRSNDPRCAWHRDRQSFPAAAGATGKR